MSAAPLLALQRVSKIYRRGLLCRAPSFRLDADGVQWRVTVPANGDTTITATFETRY